MHIFEKQRTLLSLIQDELSNRQLQGKWVSILYEWLRDYQKLEDEIAFIEFNLDRSERELKRWVEGDLMGVSLSAESNGAKLEDSIEKIKDELRCKRDDLVKLIELIGTFRGLEHKILKLKYINGMTLESVATELNYSPQYIYNKHAQIKRMMEYAQSTSV
jgi:DNA-directed RNA polymerase specialized sigma subunit